VTTEHNLEKKQKLDVSNGEKAAPSGSKEAHSIDEGKKMFEWIISPIPVDDFMK
jgi:hypothetical protein